MKYVIAVLLLASVVGAKDIYLANYPELFTVTTTMPYPSCIMGLTTETRSFVVRPLTGCPLFQPGNVLRGSFQHTGNGTMIHLAWEHKGKVKQASYSVDIESIR